MTKVFHVYEFRDAEDRLDEFTTEDLDEAERFGQEHQLAVVDNLFEWNDSELLRDYRPGGDDAPDPEEEELDDEPEPVAASGPVQCGPARMPAAAFDIADVPGAPYTAHHPLVVRFLEAWHENGRADFERRLPNLIYDSEYYAKTAKDRRRFVALDSGGSGWYLLERASGIVYSIKGYGVPKRPIKHLALLMNDYLDATAHNRSLGR